jgi:hypothetical protein
VSPCPHVPISPCPQCLHIPMSPVSPCPQCPRVPSVPNVPMSPVSPMSPCPQCPRVPMSPCPRVPMSPVSPCSHVPSVPVSPDSSRLRWFSGGAHRSILSRSCDNDPSASPDGQWPPSYRDVPCSMHSHMVWDLWWTKWSRCGFSAGQLSFRQLLCAKLPFEALEGRGCV